MTKLTLIINFVLLSTMILAQEKLNVKFKDAIPVLNLGTFHMGETTDASKVEFDEHNEDNVNEIHEIAKKLAAFKPTILIVESLLKNQDNLEQSYQKYLHQPDMKFERPDEIELLAFEIGRLAGTQRIYGIDYKEEYEKEHQGYTCNDIRVHHGDICNEIKCGPPHLISQVIDVHSRCRSDNGGSDR